MASIFTQNLLQGGVRRRRASMVQRGGLRNPFSRYASAKRSQSRMGYGVRRATRKRRPSMVAGRRRTRKATTKKGYGARSGGAMSAGAVRKIKTHIRSLLNRL